MWKDGRWSVMRIIVLLVGQCWFLEENESGLRFWRNKIWRFMECTTSHNRPFRMCLKKNSQNYPFVIICRPPSCFATALNTKVLGWSCMKTKWKVDPRCSIFACKPNETSRMTLALGSSSFHVEWALSMKLMVIECIIGDSSWYRQH